ncbi:hypothetical protein TRV_04866 [Trichophyton verrucosum HKI 0517]|uniref:Uncharacterized protein n=1 Tax=Trichophyton verrucosum (strain HKI 0517) TaxID=663202 RepID=D4DCL1_TRIVH|nr:uncharacterized protein TRV_04866 [Trichophyton verrucosum HKI 0517]EFE40383.1 hypothetical protein TRV_04866 [Trichophyton verrucosum HKI 0517]
MAGVAAYEADAAAAAAAAVVAAVVVVAAAAAAAAGRKKRRQSQRRGDPATASRRDSEPAGTASARSTAELPSWLLELLEGQFSPSGGGSGAGNEGAGSLCFRGHAPWACWLAGWLAGWLLGRGI